MADIPLKPCPFCGAAGKMIHPMGEWRGKGQGKDGGHYGPEGSRITCTSPGSICCAMTASFHGPTQDADAIAAWNRRPTDDAALVSPGDIAWLERQKDAGHCGEGSMESKTRHDHNERLDRILAALVKGARVLDSEGLADKLTVGHPDAYLNAIFDFGAGLLAQWIAKGLPAVEIVDGIKHLESASRGLHALAARGAGQGEAVEQGEAETISAVAAFEIGYAWRGQLVGQTLEDSRAVGRTLQGPLFDALNIDLDGWNSFESADLGICDAKRRIIAALSPRAPANEQKDGAS